MSVFCDEARNAAYRCLYEVFENGAYSNLVLKQEFRKKSLSSQDKAFVTALFYGTITRSFTLDAVLNRYLKKDISQLDSKVRTCLRMGAWQVLYSFGMKDYAAVDSIVALTKNVSNEGAAGLVNAVLRKAAKEGKDYLSQLNPKNVAVRYSLKSEIAGCFVKWFGLEKASSVLEAMLSEPGVTLRRNTFLFPSEKDFLKKAEAEKISVSSSPVLPYAYSLKEGNIDISESELYSSGACSVQSLSAMLVAHIACPQAGMDILDTCSAPGGKTAHMAELMGNTGHIDALDANEVRLRMVSETAERLGLSCIRTMPYDCTYLKEEKEKLLKEYDLVLCDVPCSGLGLLHRKPDIRLTMTYEKMQALIAVQKEILENSCERVKRGGTLIYSTCTIDPDENEKQIDAFLDTHPEFERIAFTELLSEMLQSNGRIREESAKGYMTLLPDEGPFDGFFMARLRRKD
ncbi:MAG: 16S rRNA (cytosine(967)-C(5))-methyltransferase RsmB [Clostridiales bacterium]|nr:16S rRNA (cytosine(967)-C(5))-methyltransferase RsmB [Clostridiales bacterium]